MSGQERIEDGELAGDGEVLEIAAIERGNFEVNATLCECVLEEARLPRRWAGGEAVQVHVSHKRLILREMEAVPRGAAREFEGALSQPRCASETGMLKSKS